MKFISMSLTATVPVTPTVDCMRIDTGEFFLAVRLSAELSFILPGLNLESATYARAFAAALTKAADAMCPSVVDVPGEAERVAAAESEGMAPAADAGGSAVTCGQCGRDCADCLCRAPAWKEWQRPPMPPKAPAPDVSRGADAPPERD